MATKEPDFVLGIGNEKSDGRAMYRVWADGFLSPHKNSLEASDTVKSDFEAAGKVYGGWDYYAVRGSLADLNIDGDAEVTINGDPVGRQCALDYRPDRLSASEPNPEPTPTHEAPPKDVADATPRGSEAGRPGNTTTTTDEYRRLWENIAVPFDTRNRMSVAGGTYKPGAIQRTILGTEGRRSVEIVGNNEDPYAVDISAANHNIVDLVKDEHVWLEGMLWGRTQFAGVGDPMCRNMVFTDRNRPDDSPAASSSIGGKPATGRFINCEFGHRDDPDEHSAVWYGKGQVHFDRKNTFRATGDAYLVVENTVTVYIGGDQTFASGDKEVVRGTGIYPDDLGDGLNKIEPGRVL